MTPRPPGPTRFESNVGRALLHFEDGRTVDLNRRVRFTSYRGTRVEGRLTQPMNAIFKHDEAITYQLYFEDGVQADWRPEWGETLEQAEL